MTYVHMGSPADILGGYLVGTCTGAVPTYDKYGPFVTLLSQSSSPGPSPPVDLWAVCLGLWCGSFRFFLGFTKSICALYESITIYSPGKSVGLCSICWDSLDLDKRRTAIVDTLTDDEIDEELIPEVWDDTEQITILRNIYSVLEDTHIDIARVRQRWVGDSDILYRSHINISDITVANSESPAEARLNSLVSAYRSSRISMNFT
jgi:hypothetical protein